MKLDLAADFRETTCVDCLEPITVRKTAYPADPVQCLECEERKPMKKQKTNGKALNASSRKDRVELRNVTRDLPVEIDDTTCAAKGKELADVVSQRLRIKEQRRAAVAGFKETLTGLDEREKALAASVNEHTEVQSVECVEYLLPTNEVEVIRLDTGERVESRTATAEDLQVEAPWTNGPNPRPIAEHVDA